MNMQGAEKSGKVMKSIGVIMLIGLIAGGTFLYFGIFKKYQKEVIPENKKIESSPGQEKKSTELVRVPAVVKAQNMWFPISWTAINNNIRNIKIYDEMNNILLPIGMWDRKTKIVGKIMYAEFTKSEIEYIMQLRADQSDWSDGPDGEKSNQSDGPTVFEKGIEDLNN